MTRPLAEVTPISASTPAPTSQGDGREHIERVLNAGKRPSEDLWLRIQGAYRARYEDESVGSLEEGLGLRVAQQGGASYAARLRDLRRLRALGAAYRAFDPDGKLGEWKGADLLREEMEKFALNYWPTWSKDGPPAGTTWSNLLIALYEFFRVCGEEGPPCSTQGIQNALKRLRDPS